MAATLATLNAVTKEVYEGGVEEQLAGETIALQRIERTSAGTSNEPSGRYVTFPIHIKRNTGIGARNENEALPLPGQQGYSAARIGLKYLYGAIELTNQAIELIEKDYKAFVNAVDAEINGIKTDLAIDLNRQVYGSGKGTIGTVTAAGTGVTVVSVDRADLFQEDMYVDLITLPATVATAGRTVVSVDVEASTITLNTATTVAVGQVFVRAGNVDREWTGFGAIVSDTGTLYNVDPTVTPVWKASVNHNSGVTRAVSEGLFTKFADDMRVKGSAPTVILTTLGVQRAYASLLQQQRQFVNTTKFAGGWSGISFITSKGEIPIVADPVAPKGTALFLDEKAIKMYRTADWQFMDRDGSKWRLKSTAAGDFDAYTARLYQYSELGTRRRNAHGVIRDITEG